MTVGFPRTCFRLLLTAVGASIMVAGCCHVRKVAIANVKNLGPKVSTRYRYRVVEFHKLKDWMAGTDVGYGGMLMSYLKKFQPGVFADDGIPVIVKKDYDSRSDKSKWWRFPHGAAQEFLCFLYEFPTGFTLPCNFKEEESSDSFMLGLVEPDGGGSMKSSFDFYYARDEVVSFLSPLAWLFYIYGGNAPDRFNGGVEFKEDEWTVFGSGRTVDYEAKAYGIAVRLKELEESGKITESDLRRASKVYARRGRQIEERRRPVEVAAANVLPVPMHRSDTGSRPPYKILSLEREKSSDFAYRFVLELNGEPSIQTFFGIQKIFADEVRSAYHLEYPNADLYSLRIAVEPRLVNGRIEGRAEVLTITPTSLTYDANTRRGKLSVRFNAGQTEEAREWIRKNVETLARDKNIALVTGQPPPDATYYSLGEKIDGNVMTIEFKTE